MDSIANDHYRRFYRTDMSRGLGLSASFAAGLCLCASGFAIADGVPEPVCAKARTAAYDSGPAIDGRAVTVVAIGSSSTEGIARNARDRLYPAAMEARLRQRWPQADIRVLNKGRGGEVMSETLKRFETDVIALKPSLVVWQLGVNDVLRFDGVEGRKDEIKAGLKLLADKGIPVVLLDLQYAPIVIRDPDASAMQELIGGAARDGVRGRVFHFRRYGVMKALAENESVPMAAMTDPDGLHMTDAMHSCVGILLADMVSAAAPISASIAPSPAITQH
jgi:acyl-CoA thioesterase I